MNNFFDDDDNDPVEEFTPEYADEQDETSEPTKMSEVEKRFKLGECYNILLKQPLFSTNTWASAIVEKEMRTYATRRLEELLGIRQLAQPESAGFSSDEIVALKSVAVRVMGGVSVKPANPMPAVKMNPPAIQPAPKPQQSLRQATPPQPKPKQRPQQQIQPAQPRAQKQRPQPKPAPVDDDGFVEEEPELNTGVKVPEEHKDDPTLTVKNGRIYIQNVNEDGEPVFHTDKRGRKVPDLKDVTPVVLPKNYNPGIGNIHQTMYQLANRQIRYKKTSDSDNATGGDGLNLTSTIQSFMK